MRAAVFAAFLLTLLVVSSSSAHAQGHPLGLGGAVVRVPAGFTGSGFAPAPAPALLDSNEWLPYGIDGAPGAFGSTCTMPACARGRVTGFASLLPGVYAVDSFAGFVPTQGIGLQSAPLGGVMLRPGGLRLRLHNIESFPLHRVRVTVRWAANRGTLVRNDVRTFLQPDCDPAATRIPLPPRSTAMSLGPIGWETFVDDIGSFDIGIPGFGEACLMFEVGAGFGSSFGLSALFEVEIEVEPSVCGNGIVETGEECELTAGMDAPCACDETCHVPHGTPCTIRPDDVCFGVCLEGRCADEPRTDTFPVRGCDDDLFCNGVERCMEGVCTPLADSLCPPDACTMCDEALDVCEAVPGCCAPGDVCEDAGAFADASVESDGSSDDDAGTSRNDGGTTTMTDGGSASIEAGPTGDGFGFGGGGGCRCAAAGRGPSGTYGVLIGLAIALRLQRRRRRTRETPHASA